MRLRRVVTPVLFLILLFSFDTVAQERRLEYSYSKGQVLKYKRSVRTSERAAFLPDGRRDSAIDFFYTMTIDDVTADGTAHGTLTVDSVLVRVDHRWQLAEGDDELRRTPVAIRLASSGRILNADPRGELGTVAAVLLDRLTNDMQNEGILPEMEMEAGGTWQGEVVVFVDTPNGDVKLSSPVTTRFVRSEMYRNTLTARVEYEGPVTAQGQRGTVGTVQGTMWVAPEQGKKLREIVEIDATLLVPVGGGKAQLRVRQSHTLDLLN